jgi:hypothetical protein
MLWCRFDMCFFFVLTYQTTNYENVIMVPNVSWTIQRYLLYGYCQKSSYLISLLSSWHVINDRWIIVFFSDKLYQRNEASKIFMFPVEWIFSQGCICLYNYSLLLSPYCQCFCQASCWNIYTLFLKSICIQPVWYRYLCRMLLTAWIFWIVNSLSSYMEVFVLMDMGYWCITTVEIFDEDWSKKSCFLFST